jgi:ATP-dependent helicase HrpB
LKHEKQSYRYPLPIDPLIPEILNSLEGNTLTLLQAEPGAGKTTRVPAAALAAGFGPVYVLEPRRLAARMAARRVAEERGEAVGDTVGYRVRFEDVSGPKTKLWYLTEGVLTRRLLKDGELREARLVVLDEFHERHLETDLALALLRDFEKRRGDLRLLIMSATLSGGDWAEALGDAPLIQAPGKLFPVTVRYTPHSAAPLEEQVAAAVAKALKETKKHVLVFLPGAAEIREAMSACEGIARQSVAKLLPLHGDLTPEEQGFAVAPGDGRKIICSTNVAESSVTIEGVEAVVDSGLARVLTYSPWSGLARLNVEKISQASAIQRTGRAGRTSAGMAIRLYPEADFVRRPAHLSPEILRADLSGTLLLLAAHGIAWERLKWLDQPRAEMLEHARALLVRLTALDGQGRVTENGRRMADLPLHPRLARFVLAAAEMGGKRKACDLAARLAEGRPRMDQGSYGSDIDALLAADLPYNARRLRQQLLEQVREQRRRTDSHALEKALLLAFPDRVARRRGERLLLANGTAAQLARESFVHGDYLTAIEVDERGGQMPLVRMASVVEADWLLELFPDSIETCEELVWNREGERVEQRNQLRYEQLAIDESSGPPSDLQAAGELLAEKAIEAGAERFADAEELGRLMRRVQFAAGYLNEAIPEDAVVLAVRELARGCTGFAEMRAGGLLAVLQAMLPMRKIDEVAPTHVALPSGRRARIEYHDGRTPSVSSRLQDFFGMKKTPTVARGAVPLVVQLLAPNQRPVQVTTDLVSFWKNLYPQVRKELSRRYPRHAWPEEPG